MSDPDWSVSKPKKRYRSEAQILEEIDKCHANSKRALEKAESAELRIRILREQPDNADTDKRKAEMDTLKEDILRFRTYAKRQIEVRARKLGRKLAEFRTVTMGFMPDTSLSAKLK